MPGYILTPTNQVKDSFYCSHCRLLLRDAVQNHEGFRLCHDCCEEIRKKPESQCTDCGISVGSQVYPDKAARREIGSLEVYCPHSSTGCTWTGPLSSVEEHAAHCPHKGVECSNPGCGLIMTAALLDQHLEECSYREVKCPHCQIALPFCQLAAHYEEKCQHYPQPCQWCRQPVTRKDLEEHLHSFVLCTACQSLVREQATYQHHFTTIDRPHSDQEECCAKLADYFEPLMSQDSAPSPHQCTCSTQACLMDSHTCLAMFFGLEKELQSAVAKIKEYDTMKTVLQETIALQNKKIEEQACEIAKLHSQLLQITKSFEQLQRTMSMMKTHISEVDLQLQASLASTQPGSFLWRIPEVARKRCGDIEGTSIYSPPFYSGQNGYKMCMRAYLNGDGIGFNTHLSVFFVLMRGEYDPLLKWPFESKVSLILVDQNLRQHIVQALNPSPESSSFQKPCLDMNVASGCPQFAKLSVLEEGNYVKDDVMFLKCIVDTAKMTHPGTLQ